MLLWKHHNPHSCHSKGEEDMLAIKLSPRILVFLNKMEGFFPSFSRGFAIRPQLEEINLTTLGGKRLQFSLSKWHPLLQSTHAFFNFCRVILWKKGITWEKKLRNYGTFFVVVKGEKRGKKAISWNNITLSLSILNELRCYLRNWRGGIWIDLKSQKIEESCIYV